jgi:hypothetical protein
MRLCASSGLSGCGQFACIACIVLVCCCWWLRSRPSKGTYRLFNMPVPWEWDDDHRTAESGQVCT